MCIRDSIYTIGIFDGANPNGNNDVNNYMNAMSSNYPEATSYNLSLIHI